VTDLDPEDVFRANREETRRSIEEVDDSRPFMRLNYERKQELESL